MKVLYNPLFVEIEEELQQYQGKIFTLLILFNGGCLLQDEMGSKIWFSSVIGFETYRECNDEDAK